MPYWYNVRTGKVEAEGQTSRKEELMGPYESADDALRALALARERTAAWDEQDSRLAEEEGRD